jgi:hypothetical protein
MTTKPDRSRYSTRRLATIAVRVVDAFAAMEAQCEGEGVIEVTRVG